MSEHPVDLLVETMGPGRPTILAESGRDREFRRLAQSLRGEAERLVEDTTAQVKRTGEPVQVFDTGIAAAVLGPTLAATPVRGVGSGAPMFAVQFSPTLAEAEQRASTIAAYEWELGLEELPPRLLLDDRWLDLTNTGKEFRDRAIFGPQDFFRPIIRIRDIVELWEDLRRATPDTAKIGTVLTRIDEGPLKRMHWAQRCVSTDAGPRMRGLLRDVTDTVTTAEMRLELLENRVGTESLRLQDAFGVIGDISYPYAPLILKWLTPLVPDIGHGVSTGQTVAIHPDDFANVLQWINEAKQGRTVIGQGRVRRGGGGWLKMTFHASLLDPEFFPTIGLTLVYPADVAVLDPVSASDSVSRDAG
ncbi:DUF5593 domain-containing protein [Nocardia uniformis]|uniref:DUF5593 domain-containing protein n=1 Tax=Nocardia uniformis TaxID=53432 RepID=A0A849C7X8_9NOCA|nr:GAF domain-containing protein [Nocardia uniformis]NNH73848.1 DUF5593 domain-containing protein [Nocardia uniformis]